MTNIDLSKTDDLIYSESKDFEDIVEGEMEQIVKYYKKKGDVSKKIAKKSNLYLYDYRAPLFTDYPTDNLEIISNPAIQPHDSLLNSIITENNTIKISGNGNCYMNYKIYDFNLEFNMTDNYIITESTYQNNQKIKINQITLDELNNLIKNKQLKFYEVFIEKNEKLENEIEFIFTNDLEDKRKVFILKITYDTFNIKCDYNKIDNAKSDIYYKKYEKHQKYLKMYNNKKNKNKSKRKIRF